MTVLKIFEADFQSFPGRFRDTGNEADFNAITADLLLTKRVFSGIITEKFQVLNILIRRF